LGCTTQLCALTAWKGMGHALRFGLVGAQWIEHRTFPYAGPKWDFHSSIHLLLGLKCFVPYKHLWALFIYGAGSLPQQVGSRNDRLHGILFLLFFLIIFSLVIQLECALTSLSMFFLYNSCFF
jgi:hypothetical protein